MAVRRKRFRKQIDGESEISRAQRAALKNYRDRPNVVGISSGIKYVSGTRTSQHQCIQFYVTRKFRGKGTKQSRLPKFIYGRFKNGKINRKVTIPTDVISVGTVKSTCGAGSTIIGNLGLDQQNGTITLIFKNKSSNNDNFYVISCAHVIGDVAGEQLPLRIVSKCFPNIKPFATSIYSASAQQQTIDYDIAVAEINPACSPLIDLATAEGGTTLASFMPVTEITTGMAVDCKCPVSQVKRATVVSARGSIDVQYKSGFYTVQNAWMVETDGSVMEGDSGGLICLGTKAIGIIFAASSEGWAWFHPLAEAFDHVRSKVRFDLSCFAVV